MANGEPGPPRQVSHVELKAWLLVALTAALVIGFAGYVLYARGVFEPTQTLYLVADNSEGGSGGADLPFSGFPLGRGGRWGGRGCAPSPATWRASRSPTARRVRCCAATRPTSCRCSSPTRGRCWRTWSACRRPTRA